MIARIGRAYYRFMNLEWLTERGVPSALVVTAISFGIGLWAVTQAYRALVLRIPAPGRFGFSLTGGELIFNGIVHMLFSLALFGFGVFFVLRWKEERHSAKP